MNHDIDTRSHNEDHEDHQRALESEAIPLGPETQAIIIQSIN